MERRGEGLEVGTRVGMLRLRMICAKRRSFSAQHDRIDGRREFPPVTTLQKPSLASSSSPAEILRSDDGVAWSAAEVLRQKFSPAEIEIACLHQLAPELAETVSRFPCIIFVDAASSPEAHPGEIRVEDLGGKIPTSVTGFSHALSPLAVMPLAESLYGAKPHAFAATVTRQNFDHGESLSPAVAAALPDLTARVELLVKQYLSEPR